jgi:hypothetical protein
MGGEFNSYGRDEECIQHFGPKTRRGLLASKKRLCSMKFVS